MRSTQVTSDQPQPSVDEDAADGQSAADGSPGDEADQAALVDTAVSALERLTDLVEGLRDAPGSARQPQIQEVTHELRAIAQMLQEVSGNSTALDMEGSRDEGKPDVLADVLGTVRTVLEQIQAALAGWQAQAQAPGAAADQVPAPSKQAAAKGPAAALQAQKELALAVSRLADSVKAQGQRLAHLEKRFGLPNSTPSTEQQRRVTAGKVAWPLDLNRPLDRGSVDADLSFHDV